MPNPANQVPAIILRSPLHRLLSSRYLDDRVHRPQERSRLRTPVAYVHDGQDRILLSTDSPWWHNFTEPARLRLWLRGRVVTGAATALSATRATPRPPCAGWSTTSRPMPGPPAGPRQPAADQRRRDRPRGRRGPGRDRRRPHREQVTARIPRPGRAGRRRGHRLRRVRLLRLRAPGHPPSATRAPHRRRAGPAAHLRPGHAGADARHPAHRDRRRLRRAHRRPGRRPCGAGWPSPPMPRRWSPPSSSTCRSTSPPAAGTATSPRKTGRTPATGGNSSRACGSWLLLAGFVLTASASPQADHLHDHAQTRCAKVREPLAAATAVTGTGSACRTPAPSRHAGPRAHNDAPSRRRSGRSCRCPILAITLISLNGQCSPSVTAKGRA